MKTCFQDLEKKMVEKKIEEKKMREKKINSSSLLQFFFSSILPFYKSSFLDSSYFSVPCVRTGIFLSKDLAGVGCRRQQRGFVGQNIGVRGADAVVALLVQFERQLGPAAFHDPAAEHYVGEVRLIVFQ